MSRLLRGIFCVIETFQKYASEDGNSKARLTHSELRQLLEGEIGNFLQPHIFHAVERKLNLLDTDRDGTISFEEFLLAVFSLLNLFYLDTSLLNSEPRLVSKSEKMDGVDLRATTRSSQQEVGVEPTQERLLFAPEIASLAQPSHEDSEAGGHNKMSPWEDIKTQNLPQEVSEPHDPENQHPEEDGQETAQDGQEVAQDVPATEYDGVQFQRNMPEEVSQQSHGPTQVVPKEGGRAVRKRSDTKVRDHMAQRPSEGEEQATEKSKHSVTQDPFPQKEDRVVSEHTDLPLGTAAGKPSQTQKVIVLTDDTRTSETQEPGEDAGRTPPRTTNLEDLKGESRTSETHGFPAQEGKYETQNQSAQCGSETSTQGKRVEEGKERDRKTGPPTPEAQTQDEKCQEFGGPWKEPGTQGLSSEEGNQNLPEIKEESISGTKTRHSEDDAAEAFFINKNRPATEETLGTKGRSQELARLENRSQGKNRRATETPDKPVRKEGHSEGNDPEVSVTQSDLAPEVGSNSSDSGEPQVPGGLQSQVDTPGDSKQGSDNNKPDPQKQGAPGKSLRVQKAIVLSIQEDRQFREEQQQPAREKQDTLGAAVQPREGQEVQESTAGGESRKSPETEGSGAQ
ncbi:trichohyalin-like protein 1 [Arvicola amphibius]|uniref:trichohyalin-like protein 1 n=1 Tax=Arvicola amphibius TaxID=1047088 RepID=UPI0018E36288|nr:trichohyalin-like protein 1 [Arvicola amphibius]